MMKPNCFLFSFEESLAISQYVLGYYLVEKKCKMFLLKISPDRGRFASQDICRGARPKPETWF